MSTLLLNLLLVSSQTIDYTSTWKGQCQTATTQSPINLGTNGAPISPSATNNIRYKLHLDKHSIQFTSASNNLYHLSSGWGYLTKEIKDGGEENLVIRQIRVHSPSEHQIDGVDQDIEVQLITDTEVFIVFYDTEVKNEANGFLQDVIDSVEAETDVDLSEAFDFYEEIGEFWSYNGSLTIPDCQDRLVNLWSRRQKASSTQITQISSITGTQGKRSLKNAGDRTVVYYQGEDEETSTWLVFSMLLLNFVQSYKIQI